MGIYTTVSNQYTLFLKKYIHFVSLQVKYEHFLPLCILGWPQTHSDLKFLILPLGGKGWDYRHAHTAFLWFWNKVSECQANALPTELHLQPLNHELLDEMHGF